MSRKLKILSLTGFITLLSFNFCLAQVQNSSIIHQFSVNINYGYLGDLSYLFESTPSMYDNNISRLPSGWTGGIGIGYGFGYKKPYINNISFNFYKGITKETHMEPAPANFKTVHHNFITNYEIAYSRRYGQKKFNFQTGLGVYISCLKSQQSVYRMVVNGNGNNTVPSWEWSDIKDVAPGITGFENFAYSLNSSATIGIRVKINYSLYWYFENFMATPYIEIQL